MIETIEPEIKKEWAQFRKFIAENHQLTSDWIPDYYSIKLWEEYQEYKRRKK